MSIIQEALRRKEEEEQLKVGEGGNESAPPPPPPPAPKKKGGKPWLSVLIALVVLVAAAGGIFILFNTGLRGMLMDKKEEKNAQTKPAPQGGGETDKPQSKLGQIVSKVEETLENAKNKVEDQKNEALAAKPDTEELAPTITSAAPASDGNDEAVDSGETVNTEEPEAVAGAVTEETEKPSPNIKVITEKRPEEKKTFELPKMIDNGKQSDAQEQVVDWPAISIKGIMSPGSGNRGAVLIGSQLLSEGDTYKGVRILKISQSTVLIELKGQRRLLNTGQSLGAD